MFASLQYTYNNHPFSIPKIFVLQTWKYASVPQQEFSAACESGETSGLDGEVSGDDDHDSDNTMIHIMKSEILLSSYKREAVKSYLADFFRLGSTPLPP